MVHCALCSQDVPLVDGRQADHTRVIGAAGSPRCPQSGVARPEAVIDQAVRRIMAGERATLVVPAAKRAEALQLLAKLPPRLRALLTIATSDTAPRQ